MSCGEEQKKQKSPKIDEKNVLNFFDNSQPCDVN